MKRRARILTVVGVLGAVAGCAGQGAVTAPAQAPGLKVDLGTPRLAPDDRGNPAFTHAYTLKTPQGDQDFVWIPRFAAYQLLRAGDGKPRGAWVKELPAGFAPAEVSAAVFGGFYAAKYEASKAGDGKSLTVAKGTMPWTDVSFAEAKQVSEALAPGSSFLIGADEWTALAVWTEINGVDLRGNTLFGVDGERANVTFTAPDGKANLSGSGTSPDWQGDINLTSHTGRADGVFDLVGGVREWNSNLYLAGNQYIVQGEASGMGGTAPGYVASLSTDPVLRMYGVVGATTNLPSEHWFRGDAYHALGQSAPGQSDYTQEGAGNVAESANFYTNRGGSYDRGHFNEVPQAGMWLLCINRNDSYKAADQGFRPSLRF
jgi:hypothetical protein